MEQNEIKEKILEYFDVDYELPKLDSPHEDHYSYSRKYYTGVTFNYIKEYVLENNYNSTDVKDVLIELYENEELRGLHCGYVKDFVFEPKKGHNYTGHYNSEFEFNHYFKNKEINE